MSPIKINKTLTVSVAAILIAIGALYYLFFYPNYDQELRETSARINSLVNIELNIDNAADITYADLSKKIEQYISETEGIYARVKKSGDSGSRDEKIIIEYLSASLKFQRAMKLRYHTENL